MPLHLALHLAKTADHPLLGVIANRARVDKDDVSFLRYVNSIVSGRCQLAEHELGVADIHLAAVGLDVNGGAIVLGHCSCNVGTAVSSWPISWSRPRKRLRLGILESAT